MPCIIVDPDKNADDDASLTSADIDAIKDPELKSKVMKEKKKASDIKTALYATIRKSVGMYCGYYRNILRPKAFYRYYVYACFDTFLIRTVFQFVQLRDWQYAARSGIRLPTIAG